MTTPIATVPRAVTADYDLSSTLARVREAQRAWAVRPLRERVRILRAARHGIAARAGAWAAEIRLPGRREDETLAAEVLPLADACRFLERKATTILRTRRPGRRGRPAWLAGSDLEVRREPWGVVLVIGPSNYPLLIPGVQAIQALAAGNAVVLKPGSGGRPVAESLAVVLRRAGVPDDAIVILGESPEQAGAAIAAGVDRVVLTGSAATGRAVLGELAPRLVPATMELSGNDAIVVQDDADLDLVARAVAFGLRFNESATCIAPRRVFVGRRSIAELEARIAAAVASIPAVEVSETARRRAQESIRDAVRGGARVRTGGVPDRGGMYPTVLSGVRPDMQIAREDLFAPIVSILAARNDDDAVEMVSRSDFALGAAVFGSPAGARALAERLDVGIVVVNDLIVPTADPRAPFGGRADSGFGSTRGAEGLLEMTRPKTVLLRRGRFRPHFDPPRGNESALFESYVRAAHGGTVRERVHGVAGLARVIGDAVRRSVGAMGEE